MESVEAEGRTVNEATTNALEQLGLSREQVEVAVLNEGRPRLLGFLGEPARVRVTPLAVKEPTPAATELEADQYEAEDVDEDYEDEDEEEEDEEEYEEEEELPPELRRAAPPVVTEVIPVPMDAGEVAIAVSTLENLLQLMSVEATVMAREPETAGDGIGLMQAVLDIDGDDLGILIGRRGQTLAALQYVLNLVVSKQTGKRASFGVDVDGYHRRREEALVGLANRMAARVKSTGRSVTLEPMPPNERRIVHITLADDPSVMTVSIGEGDARKVAITPSR